MCNFNNTFGSEARKDRFINSHSTTYHFFEDSSCCGLNGQGFNSNAMVLFYGEKLVKNINFSKNYSPSLPSIGLFTVQNLTFVKYCSIDSNNASIGRVIFFQTGQYMCQYCSFLSNTAGVQGLIQSEGNTNLTIDQCCFYNNNATAIFRSLDWNLGSSTIFLLNNFLTNNTGSLEYAFGKSTVETHSSSSNEFPFFNVLNHDCIIFDILPEKTCQVNTLYVNKLGIMVFIIIYL